jgi:class 3 adenylate cyclase
MNSNPYDYDRPVDDPSMFFGRLAVVKEITDGICSPNGISYALYGGRRMGKSSVLRQIERSLVERLQADSVPKIIPVYIDLDFRELNTRKDFFMHIIRDLQKVLQHNFPSINIDSQIIDRLSRREEDSDEPQTDFEETFKYIFDTCFPQLGGIRVTLLIDESERIMSQDHLVELRANMRALLSNRPVTRGNLVMVMAGSAKFHSDMEEGSPLKNILTEVALKILSPEATLDLIHKPTDGKISAELGHQILDLSGGHACMTQFILHGLCAAGLDDANSDKVSEIAESYPERKTAFTDWVSDLGEDALNIYSVLSVRGEPLRQRELRSELDIPPLKFKRSLDAMSFHGIIKKDENKKFLVCSRLFDDWYKENFESGLVGGQYFNEAIFVIDVCNSGLIASKHGDYALRNIASELEGIAKRVFLEIPAVWNKHRGDGFLMTFNSCEQAFHFGKRIIHELRIFNNDEEVEVPIDVRIGIHYGEISLSSEGERVSNAMNMACRIEAVQVENLISDESSIDADSFPEGNRIFLSENAVEMLSLELQQEMQFLGYFELKNIFGRHKLYQSMG